jgi:hypothetical protein
MLNYFRINFYLSRLLDLPKLIAKQSYVVNRFLQPKSFLITFLFPSYPKYKSVLVNYAGMD